MTDVSAQAFREAATRGDAWVQIEADGTWTNLLLAAAEQREQLDRADNHNRGWSRDYKSLAAKLDAAEHQVALLIIERQELQKQLEAWTGAKP